MRVVLLAAVLIMSAVAPNVIGQTTSNVSQHQFTIADEIAIAHFGDPYSGTVEPIIISPNGEFAVVYAERGLVQEDRPEDELRIYNTEALRHFVNGSDRVVKDLDPVWVIRRSTYKRGPIISK